MSDKRTGMKKKKLRPMATAEPLTPNQNVPINMPQKTKKPSKG